MDYTQPPPCTKCGRTCVRVDQYFPREGMYKIWFKCRGPIWRRLLWFLPDCTTGEAALIDREWHDYGVRAARIKYLGVKSREDSFHLFLGDDR